MADVDSSGPGHLRSLVARAGPALDEIWARCADYPAGGTDRDRREWLRAHCVRAGGVYVHRVGRTAAQIRAEAGLRAELEDLADAGADPVAVRRRPSCAGCGGRPGRRRSAGCGTQPTWPPGSDWRWSPCRWRCRSPPPACWRSGAAAYGPARHRPARPRARPGRRAVRGLRRAEPVHRGRARQARPLRGLTMRVALAASGLRHPARLQPRTTSPASARSTSPAGCPRRRPPAHLRQQLRRQPWRATWTTSSTGWRWGAQRWCSATGSATRGPAGWSAAARRTSSVQELPARAPGADARLVLGLRRAPAAQRRRQRRCAPACPAT